MVQPTKLLISDIPKDVARRIKVIATDIDGTFLGPKACFVPSAMNAYLKAKQAGLEVIPTTGRSLSGIRMAKASAGDLGQQFNPFPGIYLNGTTIFEKNGNQVSSSSINVDLGRKLANVVEDINKREMTNPQWAEQPEVKFAPHAHGVCPTGSNKLLPNVYATLCCYCADGPLRSGDPPNQLSDGLSAFNEGDILPVVGGWDSLFSQYHVCKFLMIFHSEECAKKYRPVIEPVIMPELRITCAVGRILEVCLEGIDKAVGLKFLGEKMGFDWTNVAAIGDSENDRSMLNVAGISVAMGNAKPEIQEIADYVTADYAHDGWAMAVNAIVEAVIKAKQCS